MYWNTRADDLVVKAIDRAARAQPERPEGPHRRRRHRGDDADRRPGPDPRPHGRDPRRAAADRSRLRDRPHVRRRDDRASRRWRARSASACTTSPSPAASSTWAATRWAADADPNPRFLAEKLVSAGRAQHGHHRRAHPRPVPAADEGARGPLRHAAASRRSHAAYEAGKIQPDLVPVAIKQPTSGWGLATEDEGMRPETTMEGLADAEDPVPPARPRHRRQRVRRSPTARPCRSSPAARRREGARPHAEDEARVSFAFAGVEPEIMGIGPIPSTEKALAQGRPHDRRHRPVRAERGVRHAGALAARPLRHRRRRPPRQPVGRRDRDRPPARGIGRAPHDPARGASSPSAPTSATASPRCASASARAARSSGRTRTTTKKAKKACRMTDYSTIDFDSARWPSPTTRSSRTRSCATSASPRGKMLALITLDNGRDHTRPNTLGPATLLELGDDARRAEGARGRAARSTRSRVTGKPFILAAGADLSEGRRDPGSRRPAQLIAQLGHYVARQARRPRRAVVRVRQRPRARRRRSRSR